MNILEEVTNTALVDGGVSETCQLLQRLDRYFNGARHTCQQRGDRTHSRRRRGTQPLVETMRRLSSGT